VVAVSLDLLLMPGGLPEKVAAHVARLAPEELEEAFSAALSRRAPHRHA
jgi:hypothetical protein